MANKRENLKNYFNKAKSLLKESISPGYESFFENLDQFTPFVDHLDQFVFILDIQNDKFIYASENCIDVLGREADQLIHLRPLKFMETLYHPKDIMLVIEKVFGDGIEATKALKNYDMSKQRITYNSRILQKDGTYKMMLNQFYHVAEDNERNPLIIMGTSSDITEIHNKPELFCRIHYQNDKGKWEKIHERFYSLEENAIDDFGLTPKEMEIIKFVHKGLSSKEIATLTNRSEETIKVQRKSILSKTNCQTMTDVVVMAVNNKWV